MYASDVVVSLTEGIGPHINEIQRFPSTTHSHPVSISSHPVSIPCTQVGLGMLQVLKYKADGVADIVPVDLVNNMLISVGWITGVSSSTQPIVYHFTSGSTNPVTWLQMRKSNILFVCLFVFVYNQVVCVFCREIG